jgi:branched-chain amino acid transport system substrate-binding protein
VPAQVLKVLAAQPDAVLIVAAGSPGVLPQAALVERGFKGKIYQTTGVTTNEFLRIGGKAVEGATVAQSPAIVADQLPDTFASKALSVNFRRKYEAAYGADNFSPFASNLYDASLLLDAALRMALKAAAPGTPEFRSAVRDRIEASKKILTTGGFVTMSEIDHSGYSTEAPILVVVKDGRWTYLAE